MKTVTTIRLKGVSIENYRLVIANDCSQAVNYAALELQKYLKEITRYSLPITTEKGEYNLLFSVAKEQNIYDDGYAVGFEGADLLFRAYNDRGILYAAYAFLEKLGYRFFTQYASYRGAEVGDYLRAEEFLFDPSDKDLGEDFELKANPVIYYRDAFTGALSDEYYFPKFRMNAETWNRYVLPEQVGGAIRYAGASGHSFCELLPSKLYHEKHPEYYALINGKRRKNDTFSEGIEPQFCMTNEELPAVLLERVLDRLAKNPDGTIVSVAQNDNELYCQCEKCKASYDKYDKFGTLIRFVNKIAKPLKSLRPDIKLHTYAYAWTVSMNANDEIEDNIIVQLCPRICHNHSLYDENCVANRSARNTIKHLGKISKTLFIYDYRSCLKHAMLFLPDIKFMRENMRFYAENNVQGIYSEHNIFTHQQPVMEELRVYLFGKLAFDPYMSEEEFERHIDEFLEGFYGKGWRYMKEYIEYWQEVSSKTHIDSFRGESVDEDLEIVLDEKGNRAEGLLFDKRLIPEVVAHCHELFDRASELATENQKMRIELVRTAVIWYKLFHTMEEVMAKGTEEEKKAIVAENKDLCSRMRRYFIKYSNFIGMDATTDMFHDFVLPPSKWAHWSDGCVSGDGDRYRGMFNLQK